MLRLITREVKQFGHQPNEAWSLEAAVAWDDGDEPTDDDILDTAEAAPVYYLGPGRGFAHEPGVRRDGNTATVYQRGGLDI